jgi:antitoxin MazE
MKMKVQAWGNSLGLRIPKVFAVELGVCAGTEMEVRLEGGALLAKPSGTVDLNTLLAGITPANQHEETDWGQACGSETW